MLCAGIFLLSASLVRRILVPNPTLSLSFLNSRNIIVLGLSIFIFKFVHLATIVLVPSFLGNIQQYRPLQTGHALAWVAVPMLTVVWLVAWMVIYTNSRLILVLGLTIAAVACWFTARIDSSWAGNSFAILELFLAVGFGCTYIGLVGSIVLEGLEAGALTSTTKAATFSGFMHFIRIFGGQVGAVAMARFISLREQFHSNMLGLNVERGSWLTDRRIQLLRGAMLPVSTGPEEALSRAIKLLGQQVRAQAYTMATADGLILIGWMVVAYLLLMLLLRPPRISFKDIRSMQ
jgi:DHA2 family multidrug resistance protein